MADNVCLKIEGDSVGSSTLGLVLRKLRTAAFWAHPAVQGFILSELPEYRLSKFQKALPDVFALELVQTYLLDIPATVAFLQSVREPDSPRRPKDDLG